jgi:thiamine-monophosphate kinase
MAGGFAGARSELELIREIRQGFPAEVRGGCEVRLGIGDDCAILRTRRGWETVVTTDLTLEGRHFRRDLHPAVSVGHRCLARGLSDIAAMGAEPVAAFLSLGLPAASLRTAASRSWVAGFFRGLQALAQRYRVPLAGGDTGQVVGSEIIADIILIGQAPRGKALRRSGARAGDGIYVTGTLGGAAAELRDLMDGCLGRATGREPAGSRPQSFPEPRLELGRALRLRGDITSCMDLSDGLSTDLHHLCEASGVGAELRTASLPLHKLAFERADRLELALHGGEDYELLFTSAAALPKRLRGIAITRIGDVVKPRRGRPVVQMLDEAGARSELKPRGWEHFRR